MARTGSNYFRIRFFFVLAISLLAATSAWSAGSRNLLDNGDFSRVRQGVPDAWGFGTGGTSVLGGPDGKRCLKISSPIHQYSTATQYVPIDGSRVRKVRFSGVVKFRDVVRGVHDYDVLRAFIIWYDRKGRQAGDFASAGFWTGSGGWRTFDKVIDVPKSAYRAQVILGLHECSGVCWFAHASLVVVDGDKSLDPKPFTTTDTRGWWKFTAQEVPAKGSPVDVSYLLDGPAGKHGFVTVSDGHFYFQDGTRARFWGFDIMGGECFPDHETAIGLADRLARMGVNIVRLHHMDAPWAEPNIFNPKFDDTRHLSKSSMDSLDFFLAQLKKRGIYVYLDWLVNRKFKKGDRVPDFALVDDGAKIVAHYNPRMIELQKEYMRQLLYHHNAYTGKRYVDEPQIALSEVINEDSLFYEDWYYKVPPSYLAELRDRCRKIDPKADPGRHPFDAATIRALYAIESGYYRSMRGYLKSLGLKCPTTGSNHWENMGPAMLCDADTDYIDRHYYWDHPKDGFGWYQEFDNRPMLTNPGDGFISAIAGAKVAGRPMVVTEWCFCWVNDFVAEAPLIGATYACLQDWDVMIWFDISADAPNTAMENEFDIANKPHLFAQWAAAATMFHRRDVKPYKELDQETITRAELLAGKPLMDRAKINITPRRFETRIVNDRATAGKSASVMTDSMTTEAVWNPKIGFFGVDSPRTAAICGFLSQMTNPTLGGVRFKFDSEFGALWLTSLDGRPVGKSKRILLTTATRAVNTGMTFNPGRTHLVKPGTMPILVEPFRATLTFDEEVTCTPLGQSGIPGKPVKTRKLELGRDNTFWYEITRQ